MEIILANSQQVKGLRGHKTDPSDAHLLRHGYAARQGHDRDPGNTPRRL